MSMHKIPLTPLEHQGLLNHRLPIGTPSQTSDCFRLGMAWALNNKPEQKDMNNLQSLLIRACKSKDPERRLKSVYKRYYYPRYNPKAVTQILVKLSEEFYPMTATTVFEMMAPENAWLYGENNNHYEHCVRILISHFQLAEINKLKGFRVAAPYRNKNYG